MGSAFLVRNTAYKLASEVIGRLATFALTITAARQLGEAGFGHYMYGITLGFVVAQLSDMGLQLLITRDVAMQGEAARPMIGSALRLKLWLSFLAVGLVVLLTFNQSAGVRLSLFVLGGMQLANGFLEFAAYVFRGRQAVLTEAWLLGGARVATAVAGLFLLRQGGGLLGLALTHFLVAAMVALLGLGLLRRQGWLIQPKAAPKAYRQLLRMAMPLGIAIFLSIAYSRLAILFLQAQQGATAVAHYSAAARLVEPTQLIPASLLAAAFPLFSQTWQQDRSRAVVIGRQVSGLLFAGGAALTAGLWLTADWLVVWLYGAAFADSVVVLKWLALTIPLAFVNYSLTHYLIARRLQRWITLLTAVMLIFHAGFSWHYIPRFGTIAPVVSIIIAESFLLIGCLWVLNRQDKNG